MSPLVVAEVDRLSEEHLSILVNLYQRMDNSPGVLFTADDPTSLLQAFGDDCEPKSVLSRVDLSGLVEDFPGA